MSKATVTTPLVLFAGLLMAFSSFCGKKPVAKNTEVYDTKPLAVVEAVVPESRNRCVPKEEKECPKGYTGASKRSGTICYDNKGRSFYETEIECVKSTASSPINKNNRAVCCDGTTSRSCSCGGGRGCCSRHGGVCGCN